MAFLKSYAYPGWGEFAREKFHYCQAIRVDNRIICAGQGGWNPHQTDIAERGPTFPQDAAKQIDQAFENVEINLKHAGGKGWSQVYKVVTYSTSIEAQHEAIVRNLRKWMPDHTSVWTELGIKELGGPQMLFEIDVEAYDAEGVAEAK